ncbi:GNAT family N-acetyltransferase [Amycolatopsis sp. NPDC051128]|uniref:GNAT family N-acetyltransferase n=1 Tax=Amycolatopsis sp. NPDC051128 TaxID=3155412 RepID=UPI0034121297
MTRGLVIERFDPRRATEADLAGYHDVVAASEATDRPGEPGLPFEELAGRLTRPLPGLGPAAHWVGYREHEFVAVAEARFLEDENSGIGLTEISVHPGHRCVGIGTAMLRAVVPELRARSREVVEGWQVVAGSAGQRWAEAWGFRPVRTIARQALVVAEADRSAWDVAVPAGYRPRRWSGAAPDDVVASYARARGAIHDAPLGQSGYRWPEWTVDRVRAAEAGFREQGIEQQVVVAIHEASGDVAGFTEVCVHPRRPDWAYQRDTAVLAAHRGHGLGRCVKAHMARWLVAERPALQRISTTTGAENTHMIRVNHAVGYTTQRSMIAVQEDLAALEARLAEKTWTGRRSP